LKQKGKVRWEDGGVRGHSRNSSNSKIETRWSGTITYYWNSSNSKMREQGILAYYPILELINISRMSEQEFQSAPALPLEKSKSNTVARWPNSGSQDLKMAM
jgi:hypothetical protein